MMFFSLSRPVSLSYRVLGNPEMVARGDFYAKGKQEGKTYMSLHNSASQIRRGYVSISKAKAIPSDFKYHSTGCLAIVLSRYIIIFLYAAQETSFSFSPEIAGPEMPYKLQLSVISSATSYATCLNFHYQDQDSLKNDQKRNFLYKSTQCTSLFRVK